MLTLAAITLRVLRFISSIHAALGTRTAQGEMAWAVSLNPFPTSPCRRTALSAGAASRDTSRPGRLKTLSCRR